MAKKNCITDIEQIKDLCMNPNHAITDQMSITERDITNLEKSQKKIYLD